ncbi:MAG: hypothetical protein M0D55_04845 [Elusimicrobiota bacterium]|nr:MAG: hypothetical protein M0D55_04845 [Elusimicrobiota bacterium]
MTASASTAALAGVRLRHVGSSPVSPIHLSLWSDNGDASFGAGDSKLGSAPLVFNGPSTATVQLSSAAHLQPGVPRDFFIAVDLGMGGVGLSSAGVVIEAATSFTLAAGTFSATPAFPVFTAALPVYRVVSASATAEPGLSGGVDTGFFTFFGQQLSFTSTGSAKTGPNDSATGPGGASGTTGQNTVLPSANRGELIGRVRDGANGSSPWFRIGASTSIPSPNNGVLMLAVNDFVGAYSDNTGLYLSTFGVSGSTLGAISGQVFYSTPVAGTITVFARRFGSQILGQTSFAVAASSSYPFFISDLPPGRYDLLAEHGTNDDFGRSIQEVDVVAAATSSLDATMYQSTGAITGTLSYSGVSFSGAFHVGAATTTDFTGEVHFFGGVSTPAAAAYAISGLPAPATYYVVAYRDSNNDERPNGTEPLGYHGVAGAGLFTMGSSMTAVYVAGGSTVTGVNLSLTDLGAIQGSALLTPGATGVLVVETGQGVAGSAGFKLENRAMIPLPAGGPPPGGLPFELGLLRPATTYSLFAFLDKNVDGLPSAGEEQASTPANLAMSLGGRANANLNMVALSSPAAPSLFTATPAAVSTIAFAWNLVPGATGYQLRRANASVIFSLPASASVYFDVLTDNTSSQIRMITASNGNGTSTTTALSGPVFSRATPPGAPAPSPVTALGAALSWATTNAAGTQYEIFRATGTAASGAPRARVFSAPRPRSRTRWRRLPRTSGPRARSTRTGCPRPSAPTARPSRRRWRVRRCREPSPTRGPRERSTAAATSSRPRRAARRSSRARRRRRWRAARSCPTTCPSRPARTSCARTSTSTETELSTPGPTAARPDPSSSAPPRSTPPSRSPSTRSRRAPRPASSPPRARAR